VRTEVFSRKSISVLSYSWIQYLAVRGHFILATTRQNSLVEAKWRKEQGIEIEVLYLPPYSPNLNLVERLWKYAKKKILGVYYDELWKFKSAVKNFFENTVKDKAYNMELKQFIGTAFQVLSS